MINIASDCLCDFRRTEPWNPECPTHGLERHKRDLAKEMPRHHAMSRFDYRGGWDETYAKLMECGECP